MARVFQGAQAGAEQRGGEFGQAHRDVGSPLASRTMSRVHGSVTTSAALATGQCCS
jgi:hypothetical protein